MKLVPHLRNRLTRIVVAATLAAGTASATLATAAPAGATPPDGTYVALSLANGWTTYPGARKPMIDISDGVVKLRGMIMTASSNIHPFTVPPHFRPDRTLLLPVAMCAGAYGRINITAAGVVSVLSPFGFNRASCQTSLEGVTYIQTTPSSPPLTLENGWTPVAPSRVPGWRTNWGVVHLTGEMKTAGTNPVAFVAPVPPVRDVYLPIGLCNGEAGVLHIDSSGTATVLAAVPWGNAQCLVSLDGVSYWAPPSQSAQQIGLQNGWHTPVAGAGPTQWFFADPQLLDSVELNGAMASEASSATQPYTAVGTSVPSGRVQLLAAMAGGGVGQLEIEPNGATTIWSPLNGGWPSAAAMTSLDGIQYASALQR